MRSIKVILAILLSIAMLFACTGCGEKEVTEYVIGFVGPLTGASAQDGQDALEGAQLYVEQVNAAGGIEVLPKSWTKVMRQSHFEFCIGQDLTHSIFL